MSLGWEGCQGTEVTDPNELGLVGVVHQSNGKPAADARIIAFPKDIRFPKRSAPNEDYSAYYDTVYSDKNGHFRFGSLGEGTYAVLAEDTIGTGREKTGWWKPEQQVLSKARIGLDPVLLPQGELIGSLFGEADSILIDSGVCSIEGTPYAEMTMAGVFHFLLPEGRYQLTCHKIPFTDFTGSIDIVSGQVIQRQFPMTMGAAPIDLPTPDSLWAKYDSISGVVTLTWSSVKGFDHYGITRTYEGLTGGPYLGLSQDTVWRDFPYDPKDTEPKKTFFYSVFCLKKDNFFKNGTKPLKITVTRPRARGPDLTLKFAFQDTTLKDSVFKVGDTARIAGSFRNALRINSLLQWKLKGAADSLRQVDLAVRDGEDTLALPCAAAGKVEIEFNVTDIGGFTTTASKVLQIAPAPPAAP